jgi:hypothetical protein
MTTVVCRSLQNFVLNIGNFKSDVGFQSIHGVRFIPGHVKSDNQGSCSSVDNDACCSAPSVDGAASYSQYQHEQAVLLQHVPSASNHLFKNYRQNYPRCSA